jgi:hypothetical protein
MFSIIAPCVFARRRFAHPHGLSRWFRFAATAAVLALAPPRQARSQIPAAVPPPAIDFTSGAWNLMFQGAAFAQFDDQGGPRGGKQLGSTSWGMLMASHSLAGGELQLRTMLSLDALGVTGFGYPLLLQSGEEYHGAPLHDRQHPHDAFMELGALYQRRVSSALGVSFYAAPAGEPTLGPTAFMMRPSAMDNPIAPIGHHWQDVTHVSFGVLSAGVFTKRWKLEGSWFNGREPDDQRWNFDPIRLDSWSGRLSFAPDAHWSMSASYGYLNSPEQLEPAVSEHRATVSVAHGMLVGDAGEWSSSLIWGGNIRNGESLSNSVLAESEFSSDGRNTFIARAEYVEKSASELVVDVAPFNFAPGRRFDVSEISLGYVRELTAWRSGTLGAGVLGTLNFVPSALRTAYGSSTPGGAVLFVRVRLRRTAMPGMDHMDGM